MSAKGALLGRGIAGLVVAAAFAGMALLLFTAWIAVLLSSLLGSPVWGVLAAFLFFAGVAAAAGVLGVKALSRGNLFEFPVTCEEIRKDWRTLCPVPRYPSRPDPGDEPEEAELARSHSQAVRDDLEERFRAGSE